MPKKEKNYGNRNMNDITDGDYMHATRVCEDFYTKHSSRYHDLHFKRDALLLADIFENFGKMCLEIF